MCELCKDKDVVISEMQQLLFEVGEKLEQERTKRRNTIKYVFWGAGFFLFSMIGSIILAITIV